MQPNNTNSEESWSTLRVIVLYRILLGLIFPTLYFLNLKPILVDQQFFYLFSMVSIGYAVIGVFILLFWFARYPNFFTQTFWQLILDIGYINIMVYAAGKTSSGIVILLVIPVMISAYTLPKIYSLLVAAFASLFLLFFTYLNFGISTESYDVFFQDGIIGTLLFSLVLVYTRVAQKTRKVQKIAKKQAKELENLEAINQQVMDTLTFGIVIVDKQSKVKHQNQSAKDYLGSIVKLAPSLQIELEYWLNKKQEVSAIYQADSQKPKLRVSFEPFINDRVMIVLEKLSDINEELQQLKLSSLGRLTASIAHEIRNPLSSINQATQLLKEDKDITEHEKKLTTIITNNVNRMNTMVDKIMQLSKKEHFNPESIEIEPFLKLFVYEFCLVEDLAEKQFKLDIENKQQTIYFDSMQLNQIIWNLCANSIKHSNLPPEQILIKITTRCPNEYLEICYQDNGEGIKDDMVESLFEPFFTASNTGTGLGLYICKELCHINRAEIVHVQTPEGSKFKIIGIANESTNH